MSSFSRATLAWVSLAGCRSQQTSCQGRVLCRAIGWSLRCSCRVTTAVLRCWYKITCTVQYSIYSIYDIQSKCRIIRLYGILLEFLDVETQQRGNFSSFLFLLSNFCWQLYYPVQAIISEMIRTTVSKLACAAGSRHLSAAVAGGGLSFQLTPEQNAFKELARTFARDEIIPVAAKYDRTMEYPHDVFKKAWELGTQHRIGHLIWCSNFWIYLGLVNAHIPAEYGGMGLHTVSALWNHHSCVSIHCVFYIMFVFCSCIFVMR